MLTDDEIRALQAMEAEATPGPWEWQDGCSWRRIGTPGIDGNVLYPCHYSFRDKQPDLHCKQEDAALLIAARNALRELCDEVLRLRRLRKAVNESHGLCTPECDSYGHAEECTTHDPATWLADQEEKLGTLKAENAALREQLAELHAGIDAERREAERAANTCPRHGGANCDC